MPDTTVPGREAGGGGGHASGPRGHNDLNAPWCRPGAKGVNVIGSVSTQVALSSISMTAGFIHGDPNPASKEEALSKPLELSIARRW